MATALADVEATEDVYRSLDQELKKLEREVRRQEKKRRSQAKAAAARQAAVNSLSAAKSETSDAEMGHEPPPPFPCSCAASETFGAKVGHEPLSAAQEAALTALLTRKSFTRAAEAAGVCRRTIYRWVYEEGPFKRELSARREALMTTARVKVMQLSIKAIAIMLEEFHRNADPHLALDMLEAMGALDDPCAVVERLDAEADSETNGIVNTQQETVFEVKQPVSPDTASQSSAAQNAAPPTASPQNKHGASGPRRLELDDLCHAHREVVLGRHLGKPIEAIAEAAGMTAKQVLHWEREEPRIARLLCELNRDMRILLQLHLLEQRDLALSVLESALRANNKSVARRLLRRLGMLGRVRPLGC